MNNQLNFDYDVRIPACLIQQMMDGDITCAMLVTMNVLYKWSNWNTGIVKRVSASSLFLATNEAYSTRTFQDALHRLEQMGWITRKIVNGSHKWYPLVIHNYKWVDDAGRVHILNPKNIKASEFSAKTICGEDRRETVRETSEETVRETSEETVRETAGRLQTDTSINTSLNKSEYESELKSENDSVYEHKCPPPQASPSDGAYVTPDEEGFHGVVPERLKRREERNSMCMCGAPNPQHERKGIWFCEPCFNTITAGASA